VEEFFISDLEMVNFYHWWKAAARLYMTIFPWWREWFRWRDFYKKSRSDSFLGYT
jgi:hypothetical protein